MRRASTQAVAKGRSGRHSELRHAAEVCSAAFVLRPTSPTTLKFGPAMAGSVKGVPIPGRDFKPLAGQTHLAILRQHPIRRNPRKVQSKLQMVAGVCAGGARHGPRPAFEGDLGLSALGSIGRLQGSGEAAALRGAEWGAGYLARHPEQVRNGREEAVHRAPGKRDGSRAGAILCGSGVRGRTAKGFG